ncbi:hypothetical protein LCGC14_0450020 [marine sediment metagenome]|uniref:Beta-galactosidase trimerisation domain-containing protein n=1 Tax=marine sediment metagenome TaxID=412755 RepID=A0A0F9V4V9_9ZZZZ|nr:beta-galactosidase [Phycisphaerae bacterium]HDZ43345.1 beta-galactosidase [Phycisphaerae bacterium]
MQENQLRFRQIHMDYHTTQHIAGVGAEFDPDEFADTLAKAAVDSVTVFGRCHHGWLYYDSKKFRDRIHPNLAYKHLLRDQIRACHKRNIRAPIYLTIQWDHLLSRQHPEWITLNPQGQQNGTPPYEAGFYNHLCVNSPYRQFLEEHVAEVFDLLPVDGLFLDIVQAVDCSCQNCRNLMAAAGVNAANDTERQAFALKTINDWKREMTAHIRKFSKDCTIFYNAGHVGPRDRQIADAYTHWELESLPGGGWGYLHFPATQRYARNLGLDSMGMTGKFHTSWGDFHSFKNPAALQFECFMMLALAGKCSIGDQLPPDGKICKHTYDLIGSVYREVAAKESWCSQAEPVVDIGVLTPEEFNADGGLPPAVFGATRMLQEGGHQFDFIDSKSPLGKYKVVILPDTIPVAPALAAKLEKFVAGGGKLIASFKSGLNEAGDAFALKCLGVDFVGDAPFSPDFIMPAGEIGRDLPKTEHVMYTRGLQVKLRKGAEALASTRVPYFNRTWEHFCSHRHTPSAHKRGGPGIIQKGNCIYFMHPIFTEYADVTPRWCKQLLLNALDILLPQPLIRHDGPSTVVATLNRQKTEKRLALHLLHYIPQRRGQHFDTIEDVIPLHDLTLSIKAPKKLKSVRCVPDGAELAFTQHDGRINFTLPKLEGHQIIELAL